MPIKGVTEIEENIIKSILEPYKNKYEFYYYGSRVNGNFRFLSDLDLMIKKIDGTESDYNDIAELKVKFDNSNLSYVVNIADFNGMDEHFYKLIQNDLVKA